MAILVLSPGGGVGGWVGQIKIKDQLSPAEAETWAELGKKYTLILHILENQTNLLKIYESIYTLILHIAMNRCTVSHKQVECHRVHETRS